MNAAADAARTGNQLKTRPQPRPRSGRQGSIPRDHGNIHQAQRDAAANGQAQTEDRGFRRRSGRQCVCSHKNRQVTLRLSSGVSSSIAIPSSACVGAVAPVSRESSAG